MYQKKQCLRTRANGSTNATLAKLFCDLSKGIAAFTVRMGRFLVHQFRRVLLVADVSSLGSERSLTSYNLLEAEFKKL